MRGVLYNQRKSLRRGCFCEGYRQGRDEAKKKEEKKKEQKEPGKFDGPEPPEGWAL